LFVVQSFLVSWDSSGVGEYKSDTYAADNAKVWTAYDANIPPGGKSCWYQGGTGSFCASQQFYAFVVDNTDPVQDNNNKCESGVTCDWSANYAIGIWNSLSGDGIVINSDDKSVQLYHNSVCNK
jgi:hypothetical protein